jgi:hypothetical protein
METKFQTSFIPKKPIIPQNSGQPKNTNGSVSLFMTLGVLLFLASLLVAGGSFFYKDLLIKKQETLKKQLVEREKQFNVDLIEKLKKTNTRIDTANKLLNNHIALSQIFDIVSKLTIEKVRFMSMDVITPANLSEGIKVDLRGYGTNLSAVAFQSDVLSQLEKYGLRKIIKNPIMTDPSYDGKGNVSFGLSFVVESPNVMYKKSVSEDSSTNNNTNKQNE